MKKLNYLYGIAASLLALVVYIMTLAPTVWFIDSGELAAVATTLGIAHPTGYPLFTIVGHVFSMLPIGSEPIYRLNFMSAFFCSLGVFMFFLLMRLMLTNGSITESAQPKDKAVKGKQQKPVSQVKAGIASLPDIIVYTIAAASALILAFSKTYWAAANSVEVYPLHVFFVITLMLVFFKAIFGTDKNSKETNFIAENKFYLLFAFLLGLSFTNHLTTILLAPAF